MEKYIFDERNGLWYELQGDYYLPCLKLLEGEQQPVGLWGQQHLRYIKQYRKMLYINLLTSGKLNGYLIDIDKQAEEMFFRLVKQILEKEKVKCRQDNQDPRNRKNDLALHSVPSEMELVVFDILPS